MNIAIVRGSLSRPPTPRTLPSGDHLVAYEVTVPSDRGPAETVPVVFPGASARAASLPAGAEVVVVGRVRRRFFQASGRTASRTEVVAASVDRAGTVRAGRAVARARAAAAGEEAAA